MPIQYPSLSELVAAKQYTSPVQAGVEGAMQGMQTASSMAARKAALQAKLQELGIMQQQADTASAAEKAKFIDPNQFNDAMAGKPVTAPISSNFADALTRAQEARNAAKLSDERIRFEGDQNRLSRESMAAEGAATRKQTADIAAQTAANAQLETAGKNKVAAHSWLPWETANEKTANDVYQHAADRAGLGADDKVGAYLKSIGAKDTPANRQWAQPKVGK